jgi:prepilin-type processing-associated H-X9-DG protein
VLAIIGALAAILLPAIQSSREAARRAQCANQLRQLGIAASNNVTAKGSFPPGIQQWFFNSTVSFRGIPVFAYLLPYLEENNILLNWDYIDPINNASRGADSNTAMVLPVMICPSDTIDSNPVQITQGWVYALGSYGGNGGTRSYFPPRATADGIFHATGMASEPVQNQRAISLKAVSDGLTKTLLFGERSHDDANYKSFNDAGWGEPLNQWGWWAASTSRKMIGHVTLSAFAPINYQLPFGYSGRSGQNPSAASFAEFNANYVDQRICAYGSCHPGGANFCFADGSVSFLASETDMLVLRAISTRAGSD